MPIKLLAATLLILFSLTGHTVLIQIDGSGEHTFGQDPADPTFRFRAVYDTETPGMAESTTRVNYFNALTSFVVWNSSGSTQFNATSRRFDLGSGAIWVVNDEQGIQDKFDLFGVLSDAKNVNGVDNLRAGLLISSLNLDAVASTQIPLTLDASDFDPGTFFLATSTPGSPNIFEAVQAGIITSLTFTQVGSAAVPETSTTTLLSVGLLGLLLRWRRRELKAL